MNQSEKYARGGYEDGYNHGDMDDRSNNTRGIRSGDK